MAISRKRLVIKKTDYSSALCKFINLKNYKFTVYENHLILLYTLMLTDIYIVSDIAILVLKRDVKLQLTN